ncbi:hypothetical protein HNP37_001201 [Flavobacterium nitrogenifigens]|uniref:Uncharacterized protein n=2 Tax=Flavobacterium TaxID=237 RepID=A0A7W7IVY1_9FLAO|nr:MULTISPECIES: hypothetical protein [Flavobacterium]MBB4801162.1 hypothetical protein [Flavobacterium nitrogenifigens]MBB6385090.1 hypothetical protein [Flavobacterium notoginsengisoli]
MYKQTKNSRLEQSKRPLLHWIKRKFIIIITAFMLGMANGMHTEDNRIKGNQNYTEQHKKD